MIVVGLTGSMGCGKSTVGAMLANLGALVLDADQIARTVVAPGEPALAELVALFGPAILDTQGELNRRQLASLMFADALGVAKVEAIMHPRVYERMTTLIDTIRTNTPEAIVILEIPLLFETQGEKLCDKVMLVACGSSQRQRLTARGQGMQGSALEAALARQLPEIEKRQRADWVIDNSGTQDATRTQIEQLWNRIQALR